MSGSIIVTWGLIWGLMIGAGALIGDYKGRFGEGIAWTAILGVIGLVIIALRSPTERVQIRRAQHRLRIEEAARAGLGSWRPS
jgi:hypothetical protein